METAGYTTLTRQSGLMREMQVVAHNLANAATSGFRREGVVFTEHVVRLDGEKSVSMASATARLVDLKPAGLSQTGGVFDIGIQGDGFFMVQTPEGERLTRAGTFTPSAEGILVTPDGFPLLDAGGAPVVVPTDTSSIRISIDGTMSASGGVIAEIGLWRPVDPASLRHQSGVLFSAGDVEPVEQSTVRQGFVEDSNVDPMTEVARMIEVQRAYEMGQKFLESEDQRQKGVIQTLGR